MKLGMLNQVALINVCLKCLNVHKQVFWTQLSKFTHRGPKGIKIHVWWVLRNLHCDVSHGGVGGKWVKEFRFWKTCNTNGKHLVNLQLWHVLTRFILLRAHSSVCASWLNTVSAAKTCCSLTISQFRGMKLMTKRKGRRRHTFQNQVIFFYFLSRPPIANPFPRVS